MIYLIAFIIGFLIGRYVHLPIKQKLFQLACPHDEFSCREVGFQSFCTCKKCGKVWS